jgi:hypothetical protein
MNPKIKAVLLCFAVLASFTFAEVGGDTSEGAQVFTEALAAQDPTKKASLEDWTNAIFNLGNAIVDAVPDSETKTKVATLVADLQKAVLDGEEGKVMSIIGDFINLIKDFKAFKKA